MTTLQKMIELSNNIVSVSAQRNERRQEAAVRPTVEVANEQPSAIETIPVEQFRARRLCVPAGAHDHEYHIPRHFTPGAKW